MRNRWKRKGTAPQIYLLFKVSVEDSRSVRLSLGKDPAQCERSAYVQWVRKTV